MRRIVMSKRLMTRSKTAGVSPATEPPLPRTRSSASRVVDDHSKPVTMPDQPFAAGPASEIDPELRHRMISETAYRHYAERGYTDGGDLEDWLQAEAEIDHVLLNPSGR
jgi:hypothetical protein